MEGRDSRFKPQKETNVERLESELTGLEERLKLTQGFLSDENVVIAEDARARYQAEETRLKNEIEKLEQKISQSKKNVHVAKKDFGLN